MSGIQRQPHAVLDLPSRRNKGLKIERLLDLGSEKRRIAVLEVGAGSGGISNYFGVHAQLDCEVDAIDVHDSRLVTDGFRFTLVSDVDIPFADDSFDVVISNHVIEHVGDHAAQARHLEEIARVLKSDGRGYLAVPNRWMLVEPHFKLIFLSWLPKSLRSPYVRALRKGPVYDCVPLTLPELEALLEGAGLVFENRSVEALHETVEIEHPGTLLEKFVRAVPAGGFGAFRSLIPTHIYTFRVDK